MKTRILFLLFGICCCSGLHAQYNGNLTIDTVFNRIVRQLTLYPQEKIYVQTDRGVYLPGDTLWLKAYLVHATFHTTLYQSRYVYAELVTPHHTTVERVILRQEEGTFQGYIVLPESMADGNYTLRAYTHYMEGTGEDYFFRRNIRIVSPEWAQLRMEVKSSYKGNNASLSFRFREQDEQPVIPGKIQLQLREKEKTIKVQDDSWLNADFNLHDLSQNKAMLLSWKNNEGEFYHKYLPLTTDREDFDVNFYPEGGYLLAGTPCRTAYKTLGISGHSQWVSLELLDNNDVVIATDTTLHAGMGSFSFIPAARTKYRARCTNRSGMSKIFPLPAVQTAAFALKVETGTEEISVTLQSAKGQKSDSMYFVAHVRGGIVYAGWWPTSQEKLCLNKKYFPAGIAQLLLLDKQMRPLSERLVFCYPQNDIKCRFRTDRPVYGKREEINAHLQISDKQGYGLKGHLSVAVVANKTVGADAECHILSCLLLSSEVKGYIETPAYYFQFTNPTVQASMDLLMMTQGWRRYNLPEILRGHPAHPTTEAEQNMKISGRVKDKFILSRNVPYTVNITGIGNDYIAKTTSTQKGYFTFEGIEYEEGLGFQIKALKPNVYLHDQTQVLTLDQRSFPQARQVFPPERLYETSTPRGETADESVEYSYIGKDGIRHFLLKPAQAKASYWGSTDYENYTMKEIGQLPYHDFEELLKHMGLRITTRTEEPLPQQEPPFVSHYIYYDKRPAVTLLDGEIIFGDYLVKYLALEDIRDMVFLKTINRERVNELLEGGWNYPPISRKSRYYTDPCEYFYGCPLHKEVVVLDITTKDGFDSRNFGKIPTQFRRTFFPPGYQRPAEFYSPKYDTPEKCEDLLPDLRTTLFWQPNLRTDAFGNSGFSFYSADTGGNYWVVIEGITDKGEIVYDTEQIQVDTDNSR